MSEKAILFAIDAGFVIEVAEVLFAEVAQDGIRTDNLGHGAVIGVVPTRELIFVAPLAALRGNVAAVFYGDGPFYFFGGGGEEGGGDDWSSEGSDFHAVKHRESLVSEVGGNKGKGTAFLGLSLFELKGWKAV